LDTETERRKEEEEEEKMMMLMMIMTQIHWEYPSFCVITGLYIPILSGLILVFTGLPTVELTVWLHYYRQWISPFGCIRLHRTADSGADRLAA